MMKNQWQQFGYTEPELTNDRSDETFEFRLGLAATAAPVPSIDQVGTKLGPSPESDLVPKKALSKHQVEVIIT